MKSAKWIDRNGTFVGFYGRYRINENFFITANQISFLVNHDKWAVKLFCKKSSLAWNTHKMAAGGISFTITKHNIYGDQFHVVYLSLSNVASLPILAHSMYLRELEQFFSIFLIILQLGHYYAVNTPTPAVKQANRNAECSGSRYHVCSPRDFWHLFRLLRSFKHFPMTSKQKKMLP